MNDKHRPSVGSRSSRHRARGRRSRGGRGHPQRVTAFSLGPGASQRTLVGQLRKLSTLRPLRRQSRHRTYLDTFDGRIQTAGLRLSIEEDDGPSVLTLEPIGADGGEERAEALRISKVPAFATDLAEGRLRKRLESIVKIRRLLPLARIEIRTTGYAVLDDEEKTTVRVFFDACRVRDPEDEQRCVELPTLLRVVRIEGYAKAEARVLAHLAAQPGASPVEGDLVTRALQALGREPRTHQSGVDVHLDPNQPAGAAFLALQRALVESMRENEPGIRADVDSECLHDFRVAVRRSRVLHRLFRDEIRESAFAELLPEFKWLGRVTGPTRDLDVHLLELAEQERAAPDGAEALHPLVALLRERRHDEWSRLVSELESPRYVAFIARAQELLDPELEPAARLAQTGPTLGPWARHCVARANRRMRKHGRRIDRQSEDAKLHSLRIEGKRLRYLLEFFSSLHDPDDLRGLVKDLKRLQDNLGQFNDASVQIDVLRGLAHDLDRLGRANTDALLMIGRLVERASVRKEAERDDFERRFARFDAKATRDRFRRVFGSGRLEASHDDEATAANADAQRTESDPEAPPSSTEEH